MQTRVIMPQLGESVVEGTVSRWLKQPGDSVRQYEPLVEVSTDKVDSEIPSPAEGVLLQILVDAGETVAAGTLLALIGEAGEQPQAVQEVRPATAQSNGQAHITPVVARMAAEHQLDLSAIQGTGRNGRVTKKDVEAYLKEQPTREMPAWERPGDGALFRPTESYRLDPAETSDDDLTELIPLSPMRRIIADHMVRSKLQSAPHVTTVFEVDMQAVMANLDKEKSTAEKQGVKLTLSAYFLQATVQALQLHPGINAEWTREGIRLHHAQHIGIAVALDDGLIVPVIKNAQDLNLLGLARAIHDLSSRARQKQLKPDEIQGGTFTISNHGVGGSLLATPIIHQPQAAILGVGLVEKRVKVINDAIAIRPMCYLSLSFDHRLIDGAAADAFMRGLKEQLESWH